MSNKRVADAMRPVAL